MSANNQTLIVKHKDKWYVFANVMAEQWCDENGKHINELHIKDAKGVFDSQQKAYVVAIEIDSKCGEFGEGTEYGVRTTRLCKDNSKITMLE